MDEEIEIDDLTLVMIDGVKLDDPEPATPYAFSKKEQDLDSGRNILGYMERNILDHHPHTLDLTFPPMNRRQMAKLLNMLDHSSLSVTAFDPQYNALKTYTMYHGDLNPSLSIHWKEKGLYDSFTVQLVEY